MAQKQTDSETLGTLNGFWQAASILADQQLNQFAQNEALINSRHLTARKPGRSAIFVPKISGYMRRKMADFVSMFIGDVPVTFKKSLTSTGIGSKILQKVHNHYIHRMNVPYESIIYDGAYDGLGYNFAAAHIRLIKLEVESEQTETLEDGTTVTQKVRELGDIRLHVDSLPPENVRIDPSVRWSNIDDARYIGFIVYMSVNEVEEKIRTKEWPDFDVTELTTPSMGTAPAGNMLAMERRSNASPFAPTTENIDGGLVEIRYHYHYKEASDGTYIQALSITAADTRLIIDSEPLDVDWGSETKTAWPFVLGQVYAKPHELYAAALPEMARDLQIETNAIRNQRRDNVALILNPEKYVTPQAGIDPAQLAATFPGRIVQVNNLGAVQWNAPPDVTASGYAEETRIESDMDRLFSEGPMRAGVEGRRAESATAVQMMASNGSAASGLDASVFEITFVRPLNAKISAAIRQYAPEEIFMEAAKDLQVPAAMIASGQVDPVYEATKGDFSMNVFAGATQEEIAATLSTTSNIMGVVQTTYGQNANYKPLIDPLLELMGYDPDSIIPNPLEQTTPNMANLDPGGTEPGAKPSVMPRAQFLGGGGMPQGSGNQ